MGDERIRSSRMVGYIHRLVQFQHLLRFIVNVLQKQGLHLLNSSVTLVLAVRVVQLHSDLTDVVAVPIQPQNLVTELSDAPGEPLELLLIFVVYFLHLPLHVFEVRIHVAFHALSETLVDVVHRSQIPLVVSGLYFHETVVVTSLHDRIVHRKGVVEVDVREVLRKSVLPQPYNLLHPFQVIRLITQLLQSLLSEIERDVDIL